MKPSETTPFITVCILTYKRPDFLVRLLRDLLVQNTQGLFAYAILVIDNDRTESARLVVEALQQQTSISLRYTVEPQQSIARARNRALDNAQGDFAAFIDDDELPPVDWLLRLYEAAVRFGSDGVLGPVRPRFDTPPPAWIISSGVLDRPAHPTGIVLNYAQTRTGNVLLRQNVFASPGNRFDESYAMHGEDRNFFKRMIAQGQTYVWCEEAAVYETEPPERCRATYHIRRALIRGGLAWRHATRRKLLLLKSVAGFGLYMLALPFLLFGGTGLFMRYFIKSCDHLGCLCAFVGLHMDKILQTP